MNKSILLIDQSPVERLYFTNEFKKLGDMFQFYYADSATEGFKLLKRHKIDIVLVQRNLPGINGLQLVSVIKNLPKLKFVKTYFYAERIDPEFNHLAKMLGASGCLEKKADEATVQRELNAILHPALLARYVFFPKPDPAQLVKPDGML